MARILVMQGDALEGRQLCAMLRRCGHVVMLCRNGSEALVALDIDPFDLLIADMFVRSPDGLSPDGGLLLISRVRSARRSGNGARTPADVPIIALTGAVRYPHQEHFINAARRVGADMVMPKPFPLDHLGAAVDTLLTERTPPADMPRDHP
ncbi:response regulator transcription factor [Chachezhania sediminis]|uniref:response regulator transcription factor n=1 Tax=Chachezhania sediminis TaxID=2599291 RepID=UPI00131D6CDA|nr:hypothetical protein [Chachezhania sediminis]